MSNISADSFLDESIGCLNVTILDNPNRIQNRSFFVTLVTDSLVIENDETTVTIVTFGEHNNYNC